ncbi:MAG: hypothetical protein JWR63_3330, partial [Conexibacter sp.]|nr:hypothetical protein [Conexibacter sp.]
MRPPLPTPSPPVDDGRDRSASGRRSRVRPPSGVLVVALAALLAPTALAFADGGYFEGARDVALAGSGVQLPHTALVQPRTRDGGAAVPRGAALAAIAGLSHH